MLRNKFAVIIADCNQNVDLLSDVDGYFSLTSIEHRLIKLKKTASSWLRKEAEGTPQKQLPTPTTLMT